MLRKSKSKILLTLIVLSLVLPLIAPIGETAYAARPRFDDVQTFYLPIVDDEDNSTNDELFRLLSSERNGYVGEYNFRGDVVKVYIEPEQRYPMFGRVPIIIRLVAENDYILEDVNYKVTISDGYDEYISEDLVVEENYEYDNEGNLAKSKFLLAYFPETITPGDYDISLEVRDASGIWDNSLDLKGLETIEALDNDTASEDLEKEPMEKYIELNAFVEPEVIEEQEDTVEEIEKIDVNTSEEFIEQKEPQEEIMMTTETSFNTGFVSLKLDYESIVESTDLIIDKHNPTFNIKNLGRYGKVEAKILDKQGNTVYTTNYRISFNYELYENRYYKKPFYNENYVIYNGTLELLKADETTIGTHKLVLALDGEEIYEKEIEIVEKYPAVNYVEIDKFLLAGDREFKLRVSGEYITRKDLLDLEVVDSNGVVIASSKESHYINVTNDGDYTDILYTMEVTPGEEIIDYEEYRVKLTYMGSEKLVVRTDYTNFFTTIDTEVYGANLSQSSEGKIILEGINFYSDDIYTAEVSYEGELLGEYTANYISLRKLSLDMGAKLNQGSYNITIYRIINDEYSSYKEYIGHVYFHFYRDTEEPTGYPELGYADPVMISTSQQSYDGEIYIKNFIPDNYEEIEVTLVDIDGNVVGEAEIYGYSYSTCDSWTEFKMNIIKPLNEEKYYYIYKYKGKEIKDGNNDRLSVLSTDKAFINWVEIKGAIYDELVPLDEEIEFTLINGLNIEDSSKLNVYMEDSRGKLIASLVPGTIEEVKEYGITKFTGKLKFIDENIGDGEAKIVVTYDGETIFDRPVEITSKPYVDRLWIDGVISSYSKEYNINLDRTINIRQEDLKIEIYDLKGNEVDFTINRIDEWEDSLHLEVKSFNISLIFNEDLKDAYYEIYIYYENIDFIERLDYYYKGFYATKKPLLTGTSSSSKYENDDIIMHLTDFTEASNIALGERYVGYFYLRGDNYDDLEFIGSVDLLSGEEYGSTGILIPSEAFVDYPLGLYELIITRADGELFGRSYFNISYRNNKTIDPDEPGTRKPTFIINNGSEYTNNKAISLSINPDGYTLIKIANTEEELISTEKVAVQGAMSWTLPEGDGEKTIYVQFSDEEGNSSEVLSKCIIIDTVAPILSEVSVSKEDKVVIGDNLNITALGNERGKAYGVAYLNGVEVEKFSLDYSEKTDLYKYTKSLRINKEIDKIVVYLEDLAGNKSLEKEKNISMLKLETNNLTVVVKDTAGTPQTGKEIYVYNYQENIYKQSYTDAEGKAVFSLPSNLDFEIWLYSEGYWDYKYEILTKDTEIVFEIPVRKVITGRATIGTQPVPDATIILTGNEYQYYANTDQDGYYAIEIYEDTPSEFELTATHQLYAAIAQKVDSSTTEKDIQFYNKVKVYGTVRDSSGNPIKGLFIYANGKGDWQTGITDSNGNYELRLQAGEYSISHGWVQNHESQFSKITIDEATLKAGSLKNPFDLKALDFNNSFKGAGNNVKADATITQIGKTFNLIVNYKNNGNSSATGTVKVDLPEGIKVLAGSIESTFIDLAPEQSGKIILSLEVTNQFKEKKIVIPAKVNIDGKEYSIGFGELDIIDVTITTPTLVADGNFKVYGEATEGSNVSIIDRNTNKLIAIGKVTGKWYTANIVDLPEGEYQFFARAEKNGNIANSATVKVKIDPVNGVKVNDIEVITSGGNVIGMNHEIGVPAFSAWVDMGLRGNDIEIDVELDKYFPGMTVEFTFVDGVYEGKLVDGRWKAILSGWSGSGIKQIKMKITVGELVHEFVVGEVIILIDPSGYVYDTNTGDRIVGAKATLEKWNESQKVWEFWNAELYGQINPQLTDEEGKYGWMVGEGIYRVIVEKAGYENAIAGNDNSIVIPPPRDDVYIGLESVTEKYTIMKEKQAPTANHSWTIEFNKEIDAESVNSDNVYIMDESGNKLSFISPRVDGKKVILENTGTFAKEKAYTIVIKKTVKSIEGKSLNQGINMKFTVK